MGMPGLGALTSLTGGGALTAPSNATSTSGASTSGGGTNVGGPVFGDFLFPGSTNTKAMAPASLASGSTGGLSPLMIGAIVAGGAILVYLLVRK